LTERILELRQRFLRHRHASLLLLDLQSFLLSLCDRLGLQTQEVRNPIGIGDGLWKRLVKRSTRNQLLRRPIAFPFRENQTPPVIPVRSGIPEGLFRRKLPPPLQTPQFPFQVLLGFPCL
jgi:hypothetical protein